MGVKVLALRIYNGAAFEVKYLSKEEI